MDADAKIRGLIEDGILHNGLMLLFQPILSLGADSAEIFEAQLRLRTSDGEYVPPTAFLPVAERHGLMPAIDRWVMQHALDVMDVQRVVHPRLRLLVHQTLASIAASNWLPWFRDQIVQRNLIRLRPLLEFQMGDVLNHVDMARPLMAKLRKHGIEVCIANCSGTPPEIRVLSELAVSLVKLSFLTLVNKEQDLAEIVHQLRDQSIAVIAAGVEDPETVTRVWDCRPDFLQGNYLQMPCTELRFDLVKAEYL